MFTYNPNNIFAKIIAGKIPAKKVYEDDFVLAFYDINPEAPIHILVIPKGNYCNYLHFIKQATSNEIVHFFNKVAELSEQYHCGFRLITNNGADSMQSIEHFHIHILAGKNLGKLLSQ